MRRLIFVLALLCGAVYAQSWSGVLDPTRATGWSTSGATIVNRATKCVTAACNTVTSAGSSVTATQINAAIVSACNSNTYISLPAGHISLNGFINLAPSGLTPCSNLTLRGQGQNSTFLEWTSGGGSVPHALYVANGDTNFSGGVSNLSPWTAGFAQGATSITLTTATTGSITKLHTGSLLELDQQDDSFDPNNIFVTQDTGSNGTHTQEGGSAIGRPGTAPCNTPTACFSQEQQVTVVSCVGANAAQCDSGTATSPFTVVISPGLESPNWNNGKTHSAWWSNGLPISGVGIEDMSLSTAGASNLTGGIVYFQNATNSWISRVRSVNSTASTASHKHVWAYQSSHITVRDSYLYGSRGGSESYGVDFSFGSSDNLAENNIAQHVATGWICEGCTGSVFGYNYAVDNFYTALGADPAWQQCDLYHHGPDDFVLFEGNEGICAIFDNDHNSGWMKTAYRNFLLGLDPGGGGSKTENTAAFNIEAYNRNDNLLANVLGKTGYHTTYEFAPANATDAGNTTTSNHSVFSLGFSGNQGTRFTTGFTIDNDTLTKITLMRWGNYDVVHAANQFVSGEVPTGLGLYANAVPTSSCTSLLACPASFYLSSKPFFIPGFRPWPLVGPDVTGGDIAGYSGHAYHNPAAQCYLSTMGGLTNGSSGLLAFTCSYTAVPGVGFSPSSVSFGTQVSGTTSGPQVLTLTNAGTATLNITSIQITGKQSAAFSQTSTCGATLGAGASCNVTLRFAPTYIAPMTTNVVFTTNAASSPDTVVVSGIGTASGMVLYPGGTLTPKQQINVFSGPINVSSQLYPYLIGSGGMFNAFPPGQYLTGQTLPLNLACTAANCGGANSTFIDHQNLTGSPSGGYCPAPVFNTGTNPIDDIINAAGSLGYINNFILQSASYGAGAGGNSATPAPLWSQDWANNLYTDCVHHDPSLDRANSAFYLPGDYICVGGTFPNCVGGGYWQMQKKTCTNTDTSDIRCKTAAVAPACITPGTTSSPCTDGAGTNSAVWTSVGANAPLLDSNCNQNYPGSLCYSIPVSTTHSSTIIGTTATLYLSAPSTQQPGQTVTVANIAGDANATRLNCSNCVLATIGTAAPYFITYADPNGAFSGNLTAGTAAGTHNINLGVPNVTSAIIQRTMPIPYEQQMRTWTFYMFKQIDAHYKNSIGYVRAFGSKGGEMAQDFISTWPWYGTNSACSPASNCSTFTSWEKVAYTFGGQNGAGTDFAGNANLNTNPQIEAGYMSANNFGMDNNAQGTNHAYSLNCYSSPTAATACGATYGTGVPPAGALWHGGDWALEFQNFPTQANGQHPVNTLQTTNESTPGSSPGSCQTGTCSGGSCSTAGPGSPAVAITGAMSQDISCSTTTFPAPNGYPGNLPLGKQYKENNEEIYFCDAALGLLPAATYSALPTSICPVLYPTSYSPLYKAAFSTFLTGVNILPAFTSATSATFNFGVSNTFTVSASGTPTPNITLTSGSLPTGVTFVNNGNGTGTLSGTPSSSTPASLQFTATNAAGSVIQSFTLTILNQNTQGTGAGTGAFIFSFIAAGPPFYPASSRSLLNYTGYPANLTPIFTSSSVINDTNVDVTLNPLYDCYTVLATTGVGNGTQSGGANDVMTSSQGTYAALQYATGASTTVYHTQQVPSATNCPNGAMQIANTTSFLRPLYCSVGTSCSEADLSTGHPNTKIGSGPFAFSRDKTKDNVFYFLESFTQLWMVTILSDTSITTQLVFDFGAVGSCPEVTGATPVSGSILSVAGNDIAFGTGFSYTGGQGTAIQYFVYKPGSGCSAINTNTGNWYSYCAASCNTVTPSGTETVCNQANNPAGNGQHNVQLDLNAGWAKITATTGFPNSTGTDPTCKTPPGSGMFFNWQVATGNVIISSGLNGDVGHDSVGYTHTLEQFYPHANIRTNSTPTSFTNFYDWPAPLGNENHGTWTHSTGDDTTGTANTWINASANHPVCCGIVDLSPVYLNDEFFGLVLNAPYPVGGPVIRFGHTFKDESSTSFGCTNTITNTSQDGRYIIIVTPMLGQWSGCGAMMALVQ